MKRENVNKYLKCMFDFKAKPYQLDFATDCMNKKRIVAVFCRQCLAKGTKLLMYDGSVKSVEDIKINDLIMGDDSTSRRVLSTCSGLDKLYRFKPKRGMSDWFDMNSQHILSLKNRKGENVDIKIEDYLKLADWKKRDGLQAYRVPIYFKSKKITLEPYFLGLWLGDGRSDSQPITNIDHEVIDYLSDYAKKLNMKIVQHKSLGKTANYSITKTNTKNNYIVDQLRGMNLINNKHIPKKYLINDETVRLQLLAGLIDTDGHIPKIKSKHNTFEITFINKTLAYDTLFLIRSLGFRASLKEKNATIKNINYSTIAYRITAYGDLSRIPTKIKRKQVEQNHIKDNPMVFGFDIEDSGYGEYYGFTIDGNQRFVLGDFTVTHNSGKTETTSKIAIMLARKPKRGDVLIFAPTERQTELIANKIAEAIQKMPYLTEFHIIRQTQSYFKFSNGRAIVCLTSALLSEGETLRGFTAGDIILEEAGSIKDSIIQSVILPMGATTDPTIIKIGTPRGKNHFYESSKDPNYAVHQYDFSYPVKAGLIQQSYIDEQRALSTEIAFRTEYGAEFIADSDAYFNYELIENCIDRTLTWESYTPILGKNYYIGADIARMGQDSTCIMVVEANEGQGKVVQIVEISKTKLDIVIDRIRQLITYYNPKRVFIDETGLGAGVSDVLARDYNQPKLQQNKQVSGFPHVVSYGDRIVGVKFTIQSKLDFFSNLQVLMNNSKIKYPAHPKLIAQLRDFRYELTVNSNVKLHHSPQGFDDFVDALAIATKEMSKKTVGYAF